MNEASTDLWVYELLKDAKIQATPQGSSIKDVKEALKTASKKKNKNVGRPEYIAVVKDYLIVIENKYDTNYHVKKDENNIIDLNVDNIINYAVNGALHYGLHLSKYTKYNKIFSIGVSGNEAYHKITPIFIDERQEYKILDDIETFIDFSEEFIEEYYTSQVLSIETQREKESINIAKYAKELHEDMRKYGAVQDKNKPLIVAGILLALRESEIDKKNVNDWLTGDTVNTDGKKIYDAIDNNLDRENVSPEEKKRVMMSQFSLFKDEERLNSKNSFIDMTPIKHFTLFIKNKVYRKIKSTSTSLDFLGVFYSEFMSYSGGDGQSLGIILTPQHITDLMCDLVKITKEDIVFDPTAGTGSFLISAMHKMINQTDDEYEILDIKKNKLHGIELQPYMYTVANTNMLIRGDGKSNIKYENFLEQNPKQLQISKKATVGLMNPPYSQGSKESSELYEINFIKHLLDSMMTDGRVAVIVPISTVTADTGEPQKIKEYILKNHTLEGVLTMNNDTFHGVGTNTVIVVFTAGVPHNPKKEVKFINFKDDGFIVRKHIGLIETQSSIDKKEKLMKVWNDELEADLDFCIKTTIKAKDEWIHSFYYFDDSPVTDKELDSTISDYLTFKIDMLNKGRGYLFNSEEGDQIE